MGADCVTCMYILSVCMCVWLCVPAYSQECNHTCCCICVCVHVSVLSTCTIYMHTICTKAHMQYICLCRYINTQMLHMYACLHYLRICILCGFVEMPEHDTLCLLRPWPRIPDSWLSVMEQFIEELKSCATCPQHVGCFHNHHS